MSTSASAEQPVFAPGSTPTLEPVVAKLEKFILYETTSFLYVVGCDKRQCEYRVLKLDRRVSLHVAFTRIMDWARNAALLVCDVLLSLLHPRLFLIVNVLPLG